MEPNIAHRYKAWVDLIEAFRHTSLSILPYCTYGINFMWSLWDTGDIKYSTVGPLVSEFALSPRGTFATIGSVNIVTRSIISIVLNNFISKTLYPIYWGSIEAASYLKSTCEKINNIKSVLPSIFVGASILYGFSYVYEYAYIYSRLKNSAGEPCSLYEYIKEIYDRKIDTYIMGVRYDNTERIQHSIDPNSLWMLGAILNNKSNEKTLFANETEHNTEEKKEHKKDESMSSELNNTCAQNFVNAVYNKMF